MNCCDSYGKCTGGKDCAARAQNAQSGRPNAREVDGGNFWVPEPVEPLTLREHVVILSLLAAGIAAGAAVVIVVTTTLHRWLA